MAATTDGEVAMWETTTWELIDPPMDLGEVVIAKFSPDGAYLATVPATGDIELRDADSMEILRVLSGSAPPETHGPTIEWSLDGSLLLSLFEWKGRLWGHGNRGTSRRCSGE